MFSDLFKSRPRKTAIKIIRVYDGINLQPEIIAASPNTTLETVKDIKANPKRYAFKVKQKDKLDRLPTVIVEELTPPQYLEERNVNITHEVIYFYTSTRILPKHRFAKFMLFMLAWSFIGALGLIFWAAEQSKQERIDSQCYYFRKHGIPTAISIEGYEYKLNPDGSMNKIDKTFLNPYHEELLRSMTDNQCIVIDTE